MAASFPGQCDDGAPSSPLGGRWADAATRDVAGDDWASWPGWADDGDLDLPQEQDPDGLVADDGLEAFDGFLALDGFSDPGRRGSGGFGDPGGYEMSRAFSGPDGLDESDRPGISPDLGSSAGPALRRDPDLGFGPGGSSECMPPGLALHARVEEAAGKLDGMSDEGVVEVAAAARRLRARAEYLELRATREFTRRRWESDPEPVKTRDGKWRLPGSTAEHAADELAFRLVEDRRASEDRMALSLALRDRLPRLDAMLAAGKGDAYRCQVVNDMTAALSDDDARLVDELVAPEAPELRYTALRRLAAKLALRLDPDADRERKERATRKKARVERFQEQSGNWALAGREVPLGDVLASEAHIEGLARYLRSQGVPGSLRELKIVIFFDLTQGRDPRTRIPGFPAGDAGDGQDEATCRSRGHVDHDASDEDSHDKGFGEGFGDRGADAARSADDDPDDDGPDVDYGPDVDDGPDVHHGPDVSDGIGGAPPWPFGQPGHCQPDGRGPFPASINLLVPVGTAYGWSSMPGEAGREIIDPRTLREMIQSASRHPRTRWCVTLVDGQDGTAVAHGCARGQHAWDPPPDRADPFGSNASHSNGSGTNGSGANAARAGYARHGPDGCRPPGGPGPGARRLPSDQDAGSPRPAGHARDAAPAARDAAPAAARLRDQVPAPSQLDQLEEFLRRLNIAFTPIAKGECDHQQAEARYRPSRKLRHLILARDATCPAPGCGASSFHSDLDHTEPWPHGPTCQCNFGAPCRHHHRTKQAAGWTLEQPRPAEFKWTTPSGHVYYTGPTRYDT